ncbi:MAG: hypothetical protein ACOCYE_02150 [Pseudomonadota bacterium]
MVPFEEIMRRLPPARRAKIEARAAEILAEERTLRDLRKARDLTQAPTAQATRRGNDN